MYNEGVNEVWHSWQMIYNRKKTETIEAGTLGMTPIGFKLEMRIHYLH